MSLVVRHADSREKNEPVNPWTLPYLNLEYWQLMDEILSHLASTRKVPGTQHVHVDMDMMDTTTSLPDPISLFTDQEENDDPISSMDLGDTTIRIPGFIPIVSSLVETVTRYFKDEPPSANVPALLLHLAHSCL